MLRRPAAAVLLATTVLLAAGCGDDASSTPAGSIETAAYLAFRAQPTACGAQAPAPARAMQFAAPADMGVNAPVEVVLHTSCGDIGMLLDPALAPATVNSFVFLARQGYFDGTVSHRVVPGFIFQAGDPTATGSGSPGYTLPDEFPPAGFEYDRGVVAMANTGQPHSGGSQFFIALGETGLPAAYTAFGQVVDGFDVLDRIAGLPMGPNPGDLVPSRPLETVYLESVEVSGD